MIYEATTAGSEVGLIQLKKKETSVIANNIRQRIVDSVVLSECKTHMNQDKLISHFKETGYLDCALLPCFS